MSPLAPATEGFAICSRRRSKVSSTRSVDSQLVLDSPYLWIGTVDQIIDDLVRWRERWGISYWILSDQHARALTPVVTALAGQ